MATALWPARGHFGNAPTFYTNTCGGTSGTNRIPRAAAGGGAQRGGERAGAGPRPPAPTSVGQAWRSATRSLGPPLQSPALAISTFLPTMTVPGSELELPSPRRGPQPFQPRRPRPEDTLPAPWRTLAGSGVLLGRPPPAHCHRLLTPPTPSRACFHFLS